MNTLKKTVAVVLAVALVLTMGIATSLAAFPDVPSTASYAEAVNVLTNLGVITGADDGTFRPNNTITRAEAAAILVRVLNLPEMPGETPFTDVDANHWASGYINAAYGAQVINGRGNGIFDPNGNVSYEEAVKMVVAALGYEPKAASLGGWPTGYLSIASQERISSNSGGTVGQPATRATVAKLVYNALEVDMMDQNTWGSEVTFSPKKGLTLLSGLDIEKVDVVVSSSYYVDAANGDYDARNKMVKLSAAKNNVSYDGDIYDRGKELGDFDEGGTAAASLLGYACVAYVGTDDETDTPTIYAISAKNSTNSVITVNSDRLATIDEVESFSANEQAKNDDGTVYYWKNSRSDRRASSVTPDDKVLVYVNYREEDILSAGTDIWDYINEEGKGGVIEFIDNNGNGDFDVVLISMYNKEGVVDRVRVNSDGEYIFTGKTGKGKDVPENYDPEDDTVLKLFVKGENYIDPSEIAVGDTITTIGDEDESGIIIYLVSSDKIEGRSGTYDSDTDTLPVGGKAYSASPNYTNEELKGQRNVTGIFYLNADGLISYVEGTAVTQGDYGYLLGVDETTKFSRTTYEVQILEAATGLVKTYGIKSENVQVYPSLGNAAYDRLDADEVFDRLEAVAGEDSIKTSDSIDDAAARVIKYSVENGNISRVLFVNDKATDDIIANTYKDKAYNADERIVGSSDPFTDSTFVFVIDANKDGEFYFDEPDNISVVKGTNFRDRSYYTVATFSENDVVAAAVRFGSATEISLDENVFVVSGYSVDMNDDDEYIVVFTGIQNGATRKFSLYDDNDGYANMIAEDDLSIAKGSVLMVGPESNGYVDNIDILVQVDRVATNSVEVKLGEDYEMEQKDDRKDILTVLAALDQFETSGSYYYDSKILVNGHYEIDGEVNKGSEKAAGYQPRANTNIVTVDYKAGRYTAATVKNGDANDVDLKAGYKAYAFFRAYDTDGETNLAEMRGAVKDLVLYIFQDGEDDVETSSGSTGKTLSYDKWDDVEDLDGDLELEDLDAVEEFEEVVADDELVILD